MKDTTTPSSDNRSSGVRPRTSETEPPTSPAKIAKNTDEPTMKPMVPGSRPSSRRRNTARKGMLIELASIMMPEPATRSLASGGAAVVVRVVIVRSPARLR